MTHSRHTNTNLNAYYVCDSGSTSTRIHSHILLFVHISSANCLKWYDDKMSVGQAFIVF